MEKKKENDTYELYQFFLGFCCSKNNTTSISLQPQRALCASSRGITSSISDVLQHPISTRQPEYYLLVARIKWTACDLWQKARDSLRTLNRYYGSNSNNPGCFWCQSLSVNSFWKCVALPVPCGVSRNVWDCERTKPRGFGDTCRCWSLVYFLCGG